MPQKLWVAGEEVLAADWNTYIQNQVAAQFPSAATRTAQWPAPPEGALSYLADTDTYWFYNGTAWAYLVGGATPTYAARMHRGAAFSSGVGTITVPFDTATYDYNANLTVGAAAKYTVPVTGLYDVRAAVTFTAQNAVQITFLAIMRVVGTLELSRGNSFVIRGATAGDTWTAQVADTLALTAGDQIYAALANGGGNAIPILPGLSLAYMAIRKV